jgi:hypothetical protein
MAQEPQRGGRCGGAAGALPADCSSRPRSSSGRAGTNGIRGQPASRQFGLADQYTVSASQAHAVDEIYRLLIGPQKETSAGSRSIILPSGNAT